MISRSVFVLAAAALVIGAIELASFGLHRVAFGEWFSYDGAEVTLARLAKGQPIALPAAATEDEVLGPDERASNNMQALHPYLGYVLDPSRRSQWPVNEYGFLGDLPPFGDEHPDDVSVALVGGSVAENAGVVAAMALGQEIGRIPAFRGRTIRMSLLALRGMKQPQQVVAIDWLLSLGARFDIVINLDGFNEVVLAGENSLQGTNPFYPRRWAVRVAGIEGSDETRELGRIRFLESLRAGLARRLDESVLRFSVTANVIQRGVDQRLAVELENAKTTLNEALLSFDRAKGYAARGPARDYADLEARSRDLAAYWKRSSLLLHRRARSEGFRYFHFLQPNQWVEGSKRFGEEEAALARPDDYFHRETATAGYAALIEAGPELVAAGVAFTDLTMIFRDVAEPRYSDACCHLTVPGYEELARTMGRKIREAYPRGRRR